MFHIGKKKGFVLHLTVTYKLPLLCHNKIIQFPTAPQKNSNNFSKVIYYPIKQTNKHLNKISLLGLSWGKNDFVWTVIKMYNFRENVT